MKYTLVQKQFIEELKSDLYLYRHNKSGARVLILKNDDNNKTFYVGFRTPPKDNTGVPHIMEHSTLCGSKKYPVKDPFVELLKSSVNTFLNAITYPDKTIYPIASCNLQDYKNLCDIYMDAAFYPNVYTHEEIFKQEGWRYELDSLEDELKYNGIVYNEMKGAYSSVDEIIFDASVHSLFPNNTYGVDSGGNPDNIPDLTYEQFIEFYKKYYSPSNSYIYMYGDIDIDERLNWLDEEYLSKFNMIDVDSNILYEKPFEKTIYKNIFYPLSKNESLTNKTIYTFNAVLCDYKNIELIFAFKVLGYVLFEASGCPIEEAFLSKNFGESVYFSFNDESLQPNFSITVKNAPQNALKEFKNTLFKALEDITINGIDKDALLGSLNSMMFKYKEADFGSAPKGLVYGTEALTTWLYDDDNPVGRLKTNEIFNKLKEYIYTNYYEQIIKTYILDNKHSSFVTAEPSYTLLDEQDVKLKEKLNIIKNSLSKEELLNIIEENKKLKIYQETPNTEEELATIPKLKKDDITDFVRPIYNREEIIDNVKTIYHDIDTNDICYFEALFSLDNLSNKERLYLVLLKACLGDLDTTNHTYQEIDKLATINAGSFTFKTSIYSKSKEIKSYLAFSTSFFKENTNVIFELITDILLNTKFDSKKRIKEILDQICADAKEGYSSSGNRSASNRALSYLVEAYKMRELCSGLDSLDYTLKIQEQYENIYDDLINTLKSMMNKIFRKENMLCSITGLNCNLNGYIYKLANNLYKDDYIPECFESNNEVLNEGIIVPGKVNYVALAGVFNPNIYNGCFDAFEVALRFNYLWIKVRVQGGAYGASFNISKEGYYSFSSYRDPNLTNTIDIYKDIMKFVDEFNPTEEELDNYIISASAGYEKPLTPYMLGIRSLSFYITNESTENVRKTKLELLNCNKEIIKKTVKEIFKDISTNSAICVIGTKKDIEINKNIFKNTRNL